jgi:ATP-binding cassette subfamily F protein uup
VILLDVVGVGVTRPDKSLFADVSFTLATGDRLGVVGINGSGKTTLLRILAGLDGPDEGVVRRGRDLRVGFLDQRPELPDGSVRDAVGGGWRGEELLDRLGLGSLVDSATTTLSGGQAKRVALAQTLLKEADLLILDEPTNHLDIDAIAWLEDRLATFGGGLVLVTHDRHVLDRVCTRVLELDRGEAYLHDGGYKAYLADRTAREQRSAAAEATRRVLARRELEWLRRGAPARTRKPKARVEAATAIIEGGPAASVRSSAIDLAGAAAAGSPGFSAAVGSGTRGWGAAGTAKQHPATPRLGDKVIEIHDAGHRFGASWLFRHLDLALDNRERLGVVGPNGGGKTTLLEVMARRLEPTEGRVEWGPTVVLGYYDQAGTSLPPERRVREVVAGPGREPDWYDSALLERFWFDANAQHAPVNQLSGGERRRLQLLLTLARRPNVLLLDEPTNDLDLDTLRALEDFLEDWPGALVVVSHDRAFLERTVTDVVVLDPAEPAAGHPLGRRPGGYAAWEEQRRARRHRQKAIAARRSATGRSQGGAKRRSAASAGSTIPSLSTLRHRLKEADREVAAGQRRREELEAQLAEASDHETLARIGEELAAVMADLAAAEERWLTIAEQIEEAEAARRV